MCPKSWKKRLQDKRSDQRLWLLFELLLYSDADVTPLRKQSATLAIEKRVIQEVGKTMPFLPGCCHRGSEELTLMTCRLHLDSRQCLTTWGQVQIQRTVELILQVTNDRNHNGQVQNTIQHMATSSYYITTSAVMDKQYTNFNIQYTSDEGATNNQKSKNSGTPLGKQVLKTVLKKQYPVPQIKRTRFRMERWCLFYSMRTAQLAHTPKKKKFYSALTLCNFLTDFIHGCY